MTPDEMTKEIMASMVKSGIGPLDAEILKDKILKVAGVVALTLSKEPEYEEMAPMVVAMGVGIALGLVMQSSKASWEEWEKVIHPCIYNAYHTDIKR